MKYCTKCLLPETHETIEFDDKGVCNICRNHEFKKEKIDWDQKRKDFLKIIEKYRGKYAYDCIVPYSGGKDSTYTLYKLDDSKLSICLLLFSFNSILSLLKFSMLLESLIKYSSFLSSV